MEKRVKVCDCSYYPEANGKSYYIVECPFCEYTNTVYAWSARGNGKKCEKCKAIIRQKFGEFIVKDRS